MNRKEIAQQTLEIQQQGWYETDSGRVDIEEQQKRSEEGSFLLTPEQALALVEMAGTPPAGPLAACRVANQSTVDAILEMAEGGTCPAALNFASAKNPGGGFLNGAMAQEEALAASSGLYRTLLRHPAYYEYNRAHRTMMYSHHAIYSPAVPFFRDGRFELLGQPVTASILTLPAVNMGQVILKGEDVAAAKVVMKERMRAALAIFAAQGDTHLVLGAYGCGVFRNAPLDVATWWRELLEDEGWGRCFDEIAFAVLDRSKSGYNHRIFAETFPENE